MNRSLGRKRAPEPERSGAVDVDDNGHLPKPITILVEGVSDRAAVAALAPRFGVEFDAEAGSVTVIGGAGNFGRAVPDGSRSVAIRSRGRRGSGPSPSTARRPMPSGIATGCWPRTPPHGCRRQPIRTWPGCSGRGWKLTAIGSRRPGWVTAPWPGSWPTIRAATCCRPHSTAGRFWVLCAALSWAWGERILPLHPLQGMRGPARVAPRRPLPDAASVPC